MLVIQKNRTATLESSCLVKNVSTMSNKKMTVEALKSFQCSFEVLADSPISERLRGPSKTIHRNRITGKKKRESCMEGIS